MKATLSKRAQQILADRQGAEQLRAFITGRLPAAVIVLSTGERVRIRWMSTKVPR